VIDEVRTGKYRELFHPETMITGKEDAASNCEYMPPLPLSGTFQSVFRCAGTLYGWKRKDRRHPRQGSPSGRQLQWSPGILCFPFLWWRYRLWSRSAIARTPLYGLWEEVKARVLRLSRTSVGQFGCRTVQFGLDDSHDPRTCRLLVYGQ
jgi:hypothetical protein